MGNELSEGGDIPITLAYLQKEERTENERKAPTTPLHENLKLKSRATERDDEDDGEEEDDDWLQETRNKSGGSSRKNNNNSNSTKSKKKRKGKKAKGFSDASSLDNRSIGQGKENHAAMTTQRERSVSCLLPKSVRWGQVKVSTFQRRASLDSVPVCGAWPLGLGEEEGSPEETSVDQYEEWKYEEMERRIQDLPKRLRKVVTYETRQFDYKSSRAKNPLFGPVDERDRKQLLLQVLGGGEGGALPPSSVEEEEKIRSTELDQIRASRKQIGCSCHQSKSPDKLSLKKLKEELHRRHQSAPGTDKAKLAEQLREILLNEKLCSDQSPDACECFLAGVPCHADVCGCCSQKRSSAGGSPRKFSGCHNPLGNFVYKESSVKGYRGRFVDATSVSRDLIRPRSSSI